MKLRQLAKKSLSIMATIERHQRKVIPFSFSE